MAREREGDDGPVTAGVATEHERDLLRDLLCEYIEQPDRRAEIAAAIERRFRRCLAILAIDSSGFSRTVRTAGIVHFLALLERLGRVVRPLIERGDGRLLHTEADNIFAAFPAVAAAVSCADAILRDLDAANARLPEAEQIYVAMGIGYGNVLVVDTNNLHGDEMNLACKLGEDLAGRGEVLLTVGAHDTLEPSSWRFEQVRFNISGLDLPAYRLLR